MKPSLYVVSAILEFLGIVFLAGPEVGPLVRRLQHWPWHVKLWALHRWLFRSRTHPVGTALGLPIEFDQAQRMTVSTKPSPPEGASTEERVQFALRRIDDLNHGLDGLTQKVDALSGSMSDRLVRLQSSLQAHTATSVAMGLAQYKAQRVLGTITLLVGVVVGAVANLL